MKEKVGIAMSVNEEQMNFSRGFLVRYFLLSISTGILNLPLKLMEKSLRQRNCRIIAEDNKLTKILHSG